VRHAGLGRHGAQKRAAEETVLEHVAHRAFLDLGMVEVEVERARPFARAAVGGLDLEDGLRVALERVPEAERVEHPDRGQRQRVGAAVEGVVRARLGRERIDDDRGEAALSQRQREAGAVQPAADDQDVRVNHHAPDYGPRRGIVHAVRGR
jgi:hypothetical protein